MSILWGSFRETIRRSILKDNVADEDTGEYRWSDEEILDAALWALDTFAQHTAVASGTSYEGDGSALAFALPSNLFDSERFDDTGEVAVNWADAFGTPEYLDPIRSSPLLNIRDQYNYGFYTSVNDPYDLHLRLKRIPAPGEMIDVAYYAYYDRPTNDNSVVNIPRWAEGAVSFLVGAYALSGSSLKTSFIRQWGARPDTGNPEHNPVREQQAALLKMYEYELLKHPLQQRKTTYRRDDRD